jgi:hypothetical protein
MPERIDVKAMDAGRLAWSERDGRGTVPRRQRQRRGNGARETVPGTCQAVHGTSRHVPGTCAVPAATARCDARPRSRRAPDAPAGTPASCSWGQVRCDVGCCAVGRCNLGSASSIPGGRNVPGTCQPVHGTSRHVPGTVSEKRAHRRGAGRRRLRLRTCPTPGSAPAAARARCGSPPRARTAS